MCSVIFVLQTRHDVSLGIAGWSRTVLNWAPRVQRKGIVRLR